MHDVVVIGGGPVGLCAAVALAAQRMRARVLEAEAHPGAGGARVFALSHGARLILERLGVWPLLAQSTPIRAVHVSQRGRFGHTVLRAEELGLDALGHVVAEAELLQALRVRAQAAGVELTVGASVDAIELERKAVRIRYRQQGSGCETLGRVVAQADGGATLATPGFTTAHDYHQCALSALVRATGAAADHAYERFTGKGPVALLPFAGRHALIWTVSADEAAELVAMDAEQFVARLAQRFGERIGAVTLEGARASFALRLRFAHRVAGERHVLIGNAAQTLHPVAGQGFNIGLRDAFELARALGDCRRANEDLVVGVLRYRALRRLDRAGGTLFTDFLVRLFSNDDPLLGAARSAGLFLLDASGPAKRFLMRRMIFGTRT